MTILSNDPSKNLAGQRQWNAKGTNCDIVNPLIRLAKTLKIDHIFVSKPMYFFPVHLFNPFWLKHFSF